MAQMQLWTTGLAGQAGALGSGSCAEGHLASCLHVLWMSPVSTCCGCCASSYSAAGKRGSRHGFRQKVRQKGRAQVGAQGRATVCPQGGAPGQDREKRRHATASKAGQAGCLHGEASSWGCRERGDRGCAVPATITPATPGTITEPGHAPPGRLGSLRGHRRADLFRHQCVAGAGCSPLGRCDRGHRQSPRSAAARSCAASSVPLDTAPGAAGTAVAASGPAAAATATSFAIPGRRPSRCT
jgi:hypothetical protein